MNVPVDVKVDISGSGNAFWMLVCASTEVRPDVLSVERKGIADRVGLYASSRRTALQTCLP